MRRGMSVLNVRGTSHDKTLREHEIDVEGLHIGKAFRNVSGILSGSPQ